jgi:hypothetical protein
MIETTVPRARPDSARIQWELLILRRAIGFSIGKRKRGKKTLNAGGKFDIMRTTPTSYECRVLESVVANDGEKDEQGDTFSRSFSTRCHNFLDEY